MDLMLPPEPDWIAEPIEPGKGARELQFGVKIVEIAGDDEPVATKPRVFLNESF